MAYLVGWLRSRAAKIERVAAKNGWVQYSALTHAESHMERIDIVTDASGGFGLGGFCRKFIMAFQIENSTVEPCLHFWKYGNRFARSANYGFY